jgi:hypothetical protein
MERYRQYKAAGVPVFNGEYALEYAEDAYVSVTQAHNYQSYAPAVINTPYFPDMISIGHWLLL